LEVKQKMKADTGDETSRDGVAQEGRAVSVTSLESQCWCGFQVVGVKKQAIAATILHCTIS
jgi:hypothetical protein